MPAQLIFGNSNVNARRSGLPLVAPRSLAMQASKRALSAGDQLSCGRGGLQGLEGS
jgi:hypothetical protein